LRIDNIDLENSKIYMDLKDLPKEWVSCDEPYENYEVHPSGYVRNASLLTLINPTISDGGYKKVNLNSDNCLLLHRLILLTFKGVPPDFDGTVTEFFEKDSTNKRKTKYTVDHIDRDRLNNNIENLRWATMKKQAENRESKTTVEVLKYIDQFDEDDNLIKTFKSLSEASTETGFTKSQISNSYLKGTKVNSKYYFVLKDIDSDENERWKQIENTNIYISSNGRVRDSNNREIGQVVRGKFKKIYINKKYENVHYLVAKYFVKNDDEENKSKVIHIDEDTNNNIYTNLRWSSMSEIIKESNKKNSGKRIYKVNNDGNIVNRYYSIREAAEKNDISETTLARKIKNETEIDGFFYVKEEDYESE